MVDRIDGGRVSTVAAATAGGGCSDLDISLMDWYCEKERVAEWNRRGGNRGDRRRRGNAGREKLLLHFTNKSFLYLDHSKKFY